MTCRKVRKLIPLAAGDDLKPRLARAVLAHIDSCPGCREELESFRMAMARIKTAAKAEAAPDWSGGEWNVLMARVAAEAKAGGEPTNRVGPRAIRPRWAAASVLGAFLCLVVLGMLFKGPSVRPGSTPGEGGLTVASVHSPQNKVTITMVSPETGLQVVWFLDKNFDWKGDQE